jgi:hypothetical protein
MSDPLCRFGHPRSVDGVSLLKKGVDIPQKEVIEAITRGEWQSREAAFKRTFQGCPTIITDNLQHLERIRDLRNRYAHGFGRDIKTPVPPTYFGSGDLDKVSPRRLICYLGLISNIAAEVDDFLLRKFIGNFELIYYFHAIKDKSRVAADARYSVARLLQRSLTRDAKTPLSASVCQQIIKYYENS